MANFYQNKFSSYQWKEEKASVIIFDHAQLMGKFILLWLQYQTSFLITFEQDTKMDTLLYCVEARNKVCELKSKQMPTRAKILLLQGVRQRLKEVHNFQTLPQAEKSKLDLNSTFFTQTKSIICKQQEESLIEQILKKQKIKIQMDQEIQTCQDDLSEITKIVETKLEYCEQLTSRIAQQNKEIEEEVARNEKQSKLQKVKSAPGLFLKLFR